MANLGDFPSYLKQLVALGHGRDWVRRNETVLLEQFKRDPIPFRLPPEPPSAPRDRYDEL